MRRHLPHGGSNGDRPIPTPAFTAEQALWLTAKRPEGLAYLMSVAARYGRLTIHDAEEIFSHQVQILSERGFIDLYSKKLREEAHKGNHPNNDQMLQFLKVHLTRRLIDWIRRNRTLKAGFIPAEPCSCGETDCDCPDRPRATNRVVEIPEYVREAVSCDASDQAFERLEARDELRALLSEVEGDLPQSHRSILLAAMRDPAGGFERSSVFTMMTEEERTQFHPKDGAMEVNLDEQIKRAIGKRACEIPLLVRKAIQSCETASL